MVPGGPRPGTGGRSTVAVTGDATGVLSPMLSITVPLVTVTPRCSCPYVTAPVSGSPPVSRNLIPTSMLPPIDGVLIATPQPDPETAPPVALHVTLPSVPLTPTTTCFPASRLAPRAAAPANIPGRTGPRMKDASGPQSGGQVLNPNGSLKFTGSPPAKPYRFSPPASPMGSSCVRLLIGRASYAPSDAGVGRFFL